MSAIDKAEAMETNTTNVDSNLHNQLLTFYLGDQIFGIPVLYIKDIFKSTRITRVPLTPPEVAGVVNLRGRIVTSINLRHKLSIPGDNEQKDVNMNIAVDIGEELYSFIVDSVSEVMTLSKKDFEENPSTIDGRLKELSLGIYKLDGKLLIVLDVKKLIGTTE